MSLSRIPSARDVNDRVGRFDQPGVSDVLDTDVAGAVHECGSHGRYESTGWSARALLL